MRRFTFALAAVLGLVTGAAQAALVDIPVPDTAFIKVNGLDWVWAGPCAPTMPSCGVTDLSYQSQFGWRLPTLDELTNLRPSAADFVFPGANVPDGGSDPNGANFLLGAPGADAACAAPYFNVVHRHCDWRDGVVESWAGLPDSNLASETLVVRNVPVPGAAFLMVSALGGLGFATRRKAH